MLAELDRFEVRGALGSGGLGIVYEAVDRSSGATVAIKTLHDVTPDALYRLKREFRLLQGLEHPNVCQHYELFEHDGRWFISMECVRGEHILHAVRDETGEYDEVWLRDAMGQLAEALCALHEAGLVHRDLKPSNVLVEPNGRVVLLDFGFVETRTDGTVQRSQSIVGTPVYMAPEQAVQSDVGPAADWYSFGVILFEALTRQLPHEGETALAIMLHKQTADPPRASALRPDVPPDLDELCAELLRADPARRPSGQGVLRRLGRAEPSARDSRPAFASSASVMSSFVGRSDELAALRQAFGDVERGRTVSVIVEGPSGVGKTAVVRQFTEELLGRGALVLAGRCYERESVPYKAFDSVVDALARHLRRLSDADVAALLPRNPDLLVRMFPVLGAVPAFTSAPTTRGPLGEPQEQRNQAFAALREMLHRLATRRAVVITIDDWQWADADSVMLARDLLRHRDSPPLLLVVTARPAEDREGAVRVDAVSAPDTRRLQVESLLEPQAIELVGQLQRLFAVTGLDAVAIARETEGHPLYISELVRYAAARGAAGLGDQPIRLDDAIRARIAELPPEGRAIMDVLAVAGEPLPLDVVRDVVDHEAALVQRQAAMLRVAHLVRGGHTDGTIEPYHDRVREAVFDGMDAEVRLGWHRRIAHAIEASPLARIRPELLLRHLDIAGETARAAEVALAAAQRAVQAGAFDQAASLFAIALARGQYEDARKRALRIELGRALANAGRGHEAAETFLSAAAGADPATRLDCHRQAAEQLLMIGDLERGLEILRELLADVDVRMPATQKRALLSVVWTRAKLRVRGLHWKDRRATEVAPETLLRLDVLRAASHSLALVDNIRAADFNARWLQLALRVGERTRCAIALATESVYQSSQGGRGVMRARALIDTVRAIQAESNDPLLRAFLSMSEGTVEYWVCRLPRAEQLISESERIFREECTGTNLELKTARMFLTYVLRHRGSWAQLRDLRDQYVEEADRRGDRYVVTSVNRYCSALWLAADDPERARQVLAEAKWTLPHNGFHAQHWYELEARAEIAMYDRTVERDLADIEPMFEGLERSVLLRVTTVRSLVHWLRGRLALHLGRRREAQHALSQLAAVENLRARMFGAMLEASLAGRVHPELAIARLREASKLGHDHDMRLHGAAARYQLGRLLGGREGEGHVAEAERIMRAERVENPERFAAWYVPGVQK